MDDLGSRPKAEAELKLEDVTGALTERNTKFTGYEERIKNVDTVEAVMASDPERFIRILATANPEAYGRFAKVLEQAQAEAPAQPQKALTDDPEPEPDYDLGNGQMTYSREGMKKLREWDRRQGLKEAESKFETRLKPFEDDRKAAADRQKVADQAAQDETKIRSQMEKAAKWHGFVEHQDAILAALKQDKSLSLHDAYMSVVIPKLAADRTQMKQEALDEINKQPRSTSIATTASATKPAATEMKSTADITREVIASFNKQ